MRSTITTRVTVIVVFFVAFFWSGSVWAVNGFLKINGIPGECMDDKHQGWIDIRGYAHEIIQPTTATATSNQIKFAGKCDHKEFIITKGLDQSSPKLTLLCSNGERIKEIRIELCQGGGDKIRYMEYKLTDVVVNRISQKVFSGESTPTEEVSFTYGKIEWTYTAIDYQTGQPKGEVKSFWDVGADQGK